MTALVRLALAVLAIGCGGATPATPVADAVAPTPQIAEAAAHEIRPHVVGGEWTHTRVCGRPGQATGIVASGDRVLAVCDDLFGSSGAEVYERSSGRWIPSTLGGGAALAVARTDRGDLVAVVAELTGTVGEISLRFHGHGGSEDIRRVSGMEALGELVIGGGRTIFVQGLRSHSVLERGSSGWREIAQLDAFGRTSSGIDREGRLHVLHPLGDTIAHRIVDRGGQVANGELHESAGAGVIGACDGTLYAALDTMRGAVLARLDDGTWQSEDVGAPSETAAIGFDAECRVFIADRDGVWMRGAGAGAWTHAPFPPRTVERVRGVAATETELHVIYERDTSPQEPWIATAPLAEP